MNFDGKSFVKNTTIKKFASNHGMSFVRDIQPNHINNFCLTSNVNNSIVRPIGCINGEKLKPVSFYNQNGLVPHSVFVYNKDKEQMLKPQTFIVARRCERNNRQGFEYDYKRTYISKIQPTNIKYNPVSATVIDSVQKEGSVAFASTTVNVNSKTQVVIPEKNIGYSDMSIVIQKNSFVEIKIPNDVVEVTNVPDALVHLSGYIKGTFTKSGEYNIKLKYIDGEQIINIIVPYYQRLL